MKEGIIVTGGHGFIGSHLVEYLLGKYPDNPIIDISKLTYAVNPKGLEDLEKYSNYKFCNMDLRDSLKIASIIRKYDVKKLFHLAAETHVDRSFIYPRDFLEANVLGTFSILEILRSLKKEYRPRAIYMSTDEVFGDVPAGYCSEEDKISPRNPYSASKACGEMYCNAYYHSFDTPVIIIRYMNNFGPRQHPEKLIPKIITNCLENKHFSLYKGESVRGWLYVKDTPKILDLVMEKGNIGEIYHTPPVIYKTVPEIANIILSKMGKEKLFDGYKGTRLKDDERYALVGSKIRFDLGFNDFTSLEKGLSETIEWYKNNEYYWKGFA